jgi:hypothetical protein
MIAPQLSSIESNILTVLQASNTQSSVRDVLIGLAVIDDSFYDKYQLIELLRLMDKKGLVTLKGVTVLQGYQLSPLHYPKLSKSLAEKITKAIDEGIAHHAESSLLVDSPPSYLDCHLTKMEIDIVTVLQARNRRITVSQILSDLLILRERVYRKESVIRLLARLRLKDIVVYDRKSIILCKGVPVYCEADIKRLRQLKRKQKGGRKRASKSHHHNCVEEIA